MMLTGDELFLCTLEDLEGRLARLRPGGRVGRSQKYELVMVASLLRKLLIDGGSLVAQVNRTRRLRLRYSVSGWPFASGTAVRGSRVDIRRRSRSPAKTPVIAQDQLDQLDQLWPELSGIIRERHLTLDRMLAEPVVVWNDIRITAKGPSIHLEETYRSTATRSHWQAFGTSVK